MGSTNPANVQGTGGTGAKRTRTSHGQTEGSAGTKSSGPETTTSPQYRKSQRSHRVAVGLLPPFHGLVVLLKIGTIDLIHEAELGQVFHEDGAFHDMEKSMPPALSTSYRFFIT